MIPRSFVVALLALLAGIMVACGGGGGGTSAGIGGTGITSSGAITGTGSIYVNGVRFNTDNATVSVNDSPSTPSALKVGMVVKVVGTLDNNSSTTGTADTVVYDNEIKGPVMGLNDPTGDGLVKRFMIFDQTVEVSSTATVFEDEAGGNYDFNTIADGHYVEVSGFIDQAGILQATRVENKVNLTDVELKGQVSGFVPNGGAAAMGSFLLGSITVEIDANTDQTEVPNGMVTDGMAVEVKGSLSGNIVTATKIEPDDSGLGDNVENVSLEGIISGFTDINSNFMVAGQPVDASTASLEPANLVLGDGIQIEVEGNIVNGVLIANEVEARSGEVKLHATVSSVSGSTITLGYVNGTVDVLTDNRTSFKDGLTLQAIVAGTTFIEVDAYQDGAGNVIASEIKEKSVSKDLIQGPVDAPIDTTNRASLTILGVQFSVNNTETSYEDASETGIDDVMFFGNLNPGDIVKATDEVPANGVADEVEFE